MGLSTESAGILLDLSGTDYLCIGCAHDECPSRVRTIVAVPISVEWCAVWKGTVSDCLGHLQEKHSGSQYVALKNIAKFFPPWMVPRDLWQTALRPDVSGIAVDVRLFHESRCRLVHKYWVYKDPFPHPPLRGECFPNCYHL